jgi:hypothetical protein
MNKQRVSVKEGKGDLSVFAKQKMGWGHEKLACKPGCLVAIPHVGLALVLDHYGAIICGAGHPLMGGFCGQRANVLNLALNECLVIGG